MNLKFGGHIKEDSTIGEEYNAIVIALNGKKYAKFITTHFSTYVVAETAKENKILNPKTSDGIINSILLGSISLVGLISIKLYTKKKDLI